MFAAIVRMTVLEALRNRLLWILAALCGAALLLANLLGQVALTEARQLQAAVLAAALRPAAALLVAACVTMSLARESADRSRELLLAMAMPRTVYMLGRLAGFMLVALLPAAASGLALLPFSQPLWWTVSLACELWIVAAFSLFCALSMRHAIAAVAAFYLLARSVSSLQLLGGRNTVVDVVAALVPHLDAYTRTEWLLYQPPAPPVLAAMAGQTIVAIALIASAALVDLHRKEL
jgi:ABC-type Na+ efflux pump permease subunit